SSRRSSAPGPRPATRAGTPRSPRSRWSTSRARWRPRATDRAAMGSRRRGREAALQMLYQIDLSGVSPDQAMQAYWAHLGSSREGEGFANRLVRGWAERREAIDERIRDVSQHWRLERMARVDRNILRLATYELLALADVP